MNDRTSLNSSTPQPAPPAGTTTFGALTRRAGMHSACIPSGRQSSAVCSSLVAAALTLASASCDGGIRSESRGNEPGSVAAGMATPASPGFAIESVSAHPSAVSGGDVLVRISGGADLDLASIRVTVDGRDVTESFRAASPDADLGSSLGKSDAGPFDAERSGPERSDAVGEQARLGLVSGLSEAEHRFEAWNGETRLGSLEIRNHPRSGPIFSGPHQTPFVCQTEANLLGPPTDEACSAATQVSYVYRSTDPATLELPEGASIRDLLRDPNRLPPGFKPFDPAGPVPTDLAQATVGKQHVDYIVRRERGTINRAVYEIAFLHRPGDPLPSPWVSSPSWNRRLVYSFGGGCGRGFSQGVLPNALVDTALESGYAVAASSLNVFGNSCNDVLSAETASMVREHFIETFGVPAHTIGRGSSGGSMQQFLIAQNYPGLLDGLTTGVSYPDHLAVFSSSADCSLLYKVFESSEIEFSDEQKRAVSGFPTWSVCARAWAFARLQGSRCAESIPDELRYDPVENPDGARCTLHDNMSNQFGIDPQTGAAHRPLDNVGVQYGLRALQEGVIDLEQFLEINTKIGGHDADGNVIAERTVATPEALRAAYAGGRINSGAGSLGSIPIIDFRDYRDPLGDIHDTYRSFVTRSRIEKHTGRPAEHFVLLRLPTRERSPDEPRREPPFDALELMDTWLTALASDSSQDDRATKLARAKPPELGDACWTPEGERVIEPATPEAQGRCGQLYPPFADPRIVAGAPWTDDVLKCQLRPIDPADYPTQLDDDQRKRLEETFPNGVCNYRLPGREQADAPEPWARY